MSKISLELAADLSDLSKEAAILREEIELYKIDVATAGVARESLSKSGLASNTTKLYSGCERILEFLAKAVDNAPVGHDGGWHSGLLKRMSQPYLDVREQVISEALFAELNRLRGFRHRERTSYGRELDGSIVADRAKEMADVADAFRNEVEAFMRCHADKKGSGE